MDVNEIIEIAVNENGEVLKSSNNPVLEKKENVGEDNQEEFNIEETENDDHWNHSDTRYLLQFYAENKEKFRNNKIKKKDLWRQIGSKIGKADYLCDRKFRNLKGTYLKLIRRKRKVGSTPIRWPYFSLMHDILKEDVNIKKILKPIPTIPALNSTRNEGLFLVVSPYANKSTPACSTDNEGGTTPNLRRRKFDKYRQLAEEIKQRQKSMEVKIDKMNEILMKSNEIQETRNRLLQQYLEQMKK
ncbi:hypothetical protein ILUMI_07522 [Ignelater luminosus]|uniref:Myb/SANT-like DNA-binding domain-containing protein n=1 Tax=Ignelater luminosus TaxID=2038154 RepID=A0A8K0GGS5_IGNLU|nr:hypothetical protein ILUMI_07522 [Ignelater luminosus]